MLIGGLRKGKMLYVTLRRLYGVQVLMVIKDAANGNTLVPIFIQYAVPLSLLPDVRLFRPKHSEIGP